MYIYIWYRYALLLPALHIICIISLWSLSICIWYRYRCMIYSSFMFSHAQINIYIWLCVCVYICFMLSHTHTHTQNTHTQTHSSTYAFFCFVPAALLHYLSLPKNASVLFYSCCTHTLLIHKHVYVRTPAYLLFYSGFTYNIWYYIHNIGIYSCLESCRTKACHIKALLRLY